MRSALRRDAAVDLSPSGAPWREAADGLSFRNATFGDGAGIWRLVGETGVLDLNSPYAYLMMGNWFAETSVVAEAGDRLAGFVIGFVPPRQAGTVFVWQVGVAGAMRGRGLGGRMLDVLARRSPGPVRFLEATVTPSNRASEALFRGFARRHAAPCAVSDLFPAQAFPIGGHEAERLFRIGPLQSRE